MRSNGAESLRGGRRTGLTSGASIMAVALEEAAAERRLKYGVPAQIPLPANDAAATATAGQPGGSTPSDAATTAGTAAEASPRSRLSSIIQRAAVLRAVSRPEDSAQYQIYTARKDIEMRMNTEHSLFWKMSRIVRNQSAAEVVQMLLEAERYYKEERISVSSSMRMVRTSARTNAKVRNSSITQPQVFNDNGVNTADETFGWNIAMHAAAQCRGDILSQIIEFMIEKDEKHQQSTMSAQTDSHTLQQPRDLSTSTNGSFIGLHESTDGNAQRAGWDPPFPLDLGHKATATFDVLNLYGDQVAKLESACRACAIDHHKILREIFQAGEDHGYWQIKKERCNVTWWRNIVYLRGSTVARILKQQNAQKEATKRVVSAMNSARAARRKGDRLAAMSDGTIDYTKEASESYKECMREHNMFADAAASMMLLHLNRPESEDERFLPPDLVRQKREDSYADAVAAFNAWMAIDPELFSLGVEKSGLLFMAAIRHAELCRGDLHIAETVLSKLGPAGMDILDFTLQDDHGQTLRFLSRWIVDETGAPKQPFDLIPKSVDSSVPPLPNGILDDSIIAQSVFGSCHLTEQVPFFLEIIPSWDETLLWYAWPFYLLFSVFFYYLDLYLDLSVAFEYRRRGIEDGEPEYSMYFYYSVGFYCGGVLITCMFDYITTMVSIADTKNWANWKVLAIRCTLNLLQLRLPWELAKSFVAMRTSQRDATGRRIDKTARMPPMSWEQVKCAEGLFEALPMAMFQASVVINDLYKDKEVSFTQVLSLLTSYGNVAFVLGLMGPPDIDTMWRVVFVLFVCVNVVLRSASFAFVTIVDDASGYCDNGLRSCYRAVLYYCVSYLVTAIFVFKLQKKSFSVATVILSIIAFMCPVDISRFTVLKMAQPRACQLPFSIVRYGEIAVLCTLFVMLQRHFCVVTASVQYIDLMDTHGHLNRSATGSFWDSGTNLTSASSISNHTLQLNPSHQLENRWLVFENSPTYVGGLDEGLIQPRAVFPFNMATFLCILLLFNIITFILCSVMPYKIIDPTPLGLRNLCYGVEMKTLSAIFCRQSRKRARYKKPGVKALGLRMIDRITMGLLNDVEDDGVDEHSRSSLQQTRSEQEAEDQAEEQRLMKRRKENERRWISQAHEAAASARKAHEQSLMMQAQAGRKAAEVLDELLLIVDEQNIDIPAMAPKTGNRIEEYVDRRGRDMWWTLNAEKRERDAVLQGSDNIGSDNHDTNEEVEVRPEDVPSELFQNSNLVEAGEALVEAGKALYTAGKAPEALAAFDRALAFDSESEAAKKWITALRPRAALLSQATHSTTISEHPYEATKVDEQVLERGGPSFRLPAGLGSNSITHAAAEEETQVSIGVQVNLPPRRDGAGLWGKKHSSYWNEVKVAQHAMKHMNGRPSASANTAASSPSKPIGPKPRRSPAV